MKNPAPNIFIQISLPTVTDAKIIMEIYINQSRSYKPKREENSRKIATEIMRIFKDFRPSIYVYAKLYHTRDMVIFKYAFNAQNRTK